MSHKLFWKIFLLIWLTIPLLSVMAGEQAVSDDALKDLKSLDELKTRFNQDKGVPRIVLLLSPT